MFKGAKGCIGINVLNNCVQNINTWKHKSSICMFMVRPTCVQMITLSCIVIMNVAVSMVS